MSFLPVTINARAGSLAEHNPFSGEPLVAFVPLSDPQNEVWLAASMEPAASLAYNEGLRLNLRGPLNVPALSGALQTLINRHESLRGIISPDGRSMGILAELTLELPLLDFSLAVSPQDELAKTEAAEMRRVFDLEAGPLARFLLVKVADQQHHLIFIAHHVICDGWSGAVLMTELGLLYSAAVEGRSIELYPPQRYGDYSLIEQAFLHSDEGKTHEAYWLSQLAHSPPTLDLPGSKQRPRQRSYRANRIDVRLPAELVARVRAVGAANNASLVATVLAAFATLLHKLTAAEDLVIGLAAAGQALHNQPKLVGHCVNLLPLRLKPVAAMPFKEFLAQARLVVLDAFDHQGTTFGSLLPKLDLARDESRPPLVSVMFNIDVRDDHIALAGLDVDYDTLVRTGENFELYINAVDNGRDLLLETSYNSDLFTEADIRQRLDEFHTLLNALSAAPEQSLAALDFTPPQVLKAAAAFNATAVPLPLHMLPAQIFAQAVQNPEATAITVGTTASSYAQLEARANTLAARMTAAGAGKGCFVGVCLGRSAELPAALLAVMKTGAAYLPLDPDFPPERLAYTLKDSGAVLLVSETGLAGKFAAECPTLNVDEVSGALPFQAVPLAAADPAYIIYTSGSTGAPKGVVVPHGALTNFLASMAINPGLKSDDVLAAVTTISFDIAGLELWLPLSIGASLVLLDRDTVMDGERLKAALEQSWATVMQATPSTWRLLLAAGWQGSASLRALCGGEPLPRELAEQLLPKVAALHNLYGPTETTIWSTVFQVLRADAPILIGRPIANTQCHVLDASLRPLPPGITGELFIGGAGLALGYHARPELNAERFITHPSLGRLYRTGDLARLSADGLECLGRNDFQIKLRGYRIELGEIEYAISRNAHVAESVALVREKSAGDQRLVAYVVKRDGAGLTVSELRASLRNFLPAYMLPQEYVFLTELPRLPNGKLDRSKLPDPFASLQPAAAKIAPRSQAEKAIAAIWAELLQIPLARIGIDDRFLDLGGHSLLATQAAAAIRKALSMRLALRSLMMDPLAIIAAGLATAAPDTGKAPAAAAGVESSAPPGRISAADENPARPKSGWMDRILKRP